MNDDMRDIFGKALPESEPPAALSADALAAAGRRKRRQRGIGAATGGIAVVAALAVALPMAWGQGSATPAASGDGQLPELESSKVYMWDEPNKSEKAAKAEKYGEVFWGWFDENYSGYDYVSDDKLADEGEISEEPPTLQRQQTPFMSADADEVENSEEAFDQSSTDVARSDYARLTYSLPDPAAKSEDGGTVSSGPPKVRMPGSESPDALEATVYPEGQYTNGTAGQLPFTPTKGGEGFYDLVNCEGGTGDLPSYEGSVEYDTECDEAKGADGDRIVEATEKISKEDKTVSKAHTLVHYREDGSAVVLRDQTPNALEMGSEDAKSEDMKPGLGFEELTDLALALPNDPVK